jgi:hypothetical protein
VPAAAVIPAPIAYIKVVAVKKLVVEFLGGLPMSARLRVQVGGPSILLLTFLGIHWVTGELRHFTLKKLECSRQACAGIH